MKKWFSVIFVLLSVQTFSQSSFRKLINSPIQVNQCVVASLADGGIVIGYDVELASVSSTFNLIKMDSTGLVQWHKQYGIGFSWEFSRMIILPTPDSGMFFKTESWDWAVGDYDFATIYKLDKIGNIQNSIVDPWGWDWQGNAVDVLEYEKNSMNLYIFGTHWYYDVFNDQPCCYSPYFGKFDDQLNLIKTNERFEFINLIYDSVQTPFMMINSQSSNPNSFCVAMYDTSGNPIMKKCYSSNSQQIQQLKVHTIKEHNGSYYMLESLTLNATKKLAIHKTDLNFNTIYYSVLDSTSAIPFDSLSEIKMGISSAGKILISALVRNSISLYLKKPLMLELDLSSNFNTAKIGNDINYVSNAIDTSNGSFLFVRFNTSANPIEIQKEYATNPSCNFSTLNPVPYQLIINDTAHTATPFFTPSTFPNFIIDTTSAVPLTNNTFTNSCIPLSVDDIYNSKKCQILIHPNPSNNFLKIISECMLKANSEIQILNLMGSKFLSKQLISDSLEIQIDIHNLPSGIYFIKGHFADGGVFNEKIVVQK